MIDSHAAADRVCFSLPPVAAFAYGTLSPRFPCTSNESSVSSRYHDICKNCSEFYVRDNRLEEIGYEVPIAFDKLTLSRCMLNINLRIRS